MKRAELVAAVLAPVAFVGLLVGLSFTLGATLHPIVGWAVPTVVAGVVAFWAVGRAWDHREATVARRDFAGHGEPLNLSDLPPPAR